MKLSIITVNLNNAAGFQKTAESIVSQTYQDFEWIVIDGGSTDGSKELIEQYSDHIAYWVSEKDSGIYNAMNKGVKVAKGEYLQFLNSGDCLVDIDVLVSVFHNDVHDTILFGDVVVTNGPKCVGERRFPDEIGLNYYLSGTLCHQSVFIPRSVQIEYPYNEQYRMASDWEFLLKMLLKSYPFKHLEINVCKYDCNGISSGKKAHETLYSERVRTINKLVPQCILLDYENGCTGELMRLRCRHPMYSKFITSTVLILRWLDLIFGKNEK